VTLTVSQSCISRSLYAATDTATVQSGTGVMFFVPSINIAQNSRNQACEDTLVLESSQQTDTLCGVNGALRVNTNNLQASNQVVFVSSANSVNMNFNPVTSKNDSYTAYYWSDECTDHNDDEQGCVDATCSYCPSGINTGVCWGAADVSSCNDLPNYYVTLQQDTNGCPVAQIDQYPSLDSVPVSSKQSSGGGDGGGTIVIGIIIVTVAVTALSFGIVVAMRRRLRNMKVTPMIEQEQYQISQTDTEAEAI